MVNIGIIGLGKLGHTHAENILYRIPNAKLIAACARKEEVLEEFCNGRQIEYRYSSYSEMLKNDRIDAIVIVTSVNTHSEMVIEALEAGFHVFVEKPLAITTADAVKTQEAAEARPAQIFMTGYMRRFDPSYMEAKKKIDAGAIGNPVMLRAYSLDPDSGTESAPERGEANGAWYSEMIVHDVDLARWFLGSEAASIRTVGGCYKHKEFEKFNDIDNACTLMNFKNRTMAMFYTGRTAPHGSHVETEIVGTEGIIRIKPEARRNRLDIFTAGGMLRESSENYLDRFHEAFVNEMQEFVNCIEEGRRPEMTARDSRMVTEISNAAYHAYTTGELITV